MEMKLANLLILLLLVGFVGCTKNILEKYPNGNTKVTGQMKSGKMQGLWTYYFENGIRKGEGYFSDGDGSDTAKATGIPRNSRDSTWKFYDESGKMKSSYSYNHGKVLNRALYSDNEKKYLQAYFNPDDSIPNKIEGYLVNGEIESSREVFDKSILYSEKWDNGKLKFNNILNYKRDEFWDSYLNLNFHDYDSANLINEKLWSKDGTFKGKLMQPGLLKNLDIYYTDAIDSLTAFKLAEFHYNEFLKKIVNDPKVNTEGYTIYLDKKDSYILSVKLKEGLHQDEKILSYLKHLCTVISKKLLNGQNFEFALIDKDLNTIRVVLP